MKTRSLQTSIGLSIFITASAFAQNPTSRCTSLTFYGNAVSSGLCKTLSPADQNLQVCELTSAQPDIHLTFGLIRPGAAPPPAPPPPPPAPLHLTIRANNSTPPCEGNVNILRTAANAFQAAAPGRICSVDVTNYVARMNAQTIAATVPPATACRTAFLAAHAKLSPGVQQGYLDACDTAGVTAAGAPAPCP